MFPAAVESVMPLLRMRYKLQDREIPLKELPAVYSEFLGDAEIPGAQIASFTAVVEGRPVRVLAVAGPKKST